MEEDSQNEKPSVSAFFRYRSPTFSKEEVKAMLNIIEKYKTIILNRSTTSAASYAKEAAWSNIAKIFNKQGFEHVRSADCLKIKWDNLKKEARKHSKNLMDVNNGDIDDVTNQMIVMMCDVTTNPNVVGEPLESDEELNETMQENQVSNEIFCNDNEEKGSDDTQDGDAMGRFVNRSMNFTPDDCNLLLQCVRREKSAILCRTNTIKSINVKNQAWKRITHSYNRLSRQKRSTKVLRTKFSNMKRLVKNVSLKGYFKRLKKNLDLRQDIEKLEEGTKSSKGIKSEPIFDHRSSVDVDDADVEDINDLELNNHVSSSLDPLHSVLSSNFPIGPMSTDENKEIVKLKTDLLHYKMETAKLRRKQIEDSMQAEAENREAKAIETSLKLRAARLEAVAAEMKLPLTHPALSYTAEEQRAQHYILQYHTS